MRYLIFMLACIACSIFFVSCYSLSGISIPDDVEKAYIPNFEANALSAPPTLHLDMTEQLREKVRDGARLIITDESPDIELKGTLVDFRVTAEGARPGNETAAFSALNRLTIVVAIEYKDLTSPDGKSWRKNFSNYYDFPSNQSLTAVQDEAIEEILRNINEDIFNKAFAEDW